MICVLGDAHLDVVVCPNGPIAGETDTPSRTWVGAGGQAANVAAWVCALGTADLSVGVAARALAEALARTQPRDEPAAGLVHGTLYARHILDGGRDARQAVPRLICVGLRAHAGKNHEHAAAWRGGKRNEADLDGVGHR